VRARRRVQSSRRRLASSSEPWRGGGAKGLASDCGLVATLGSQPEARQWHKPWPARVQVADGTRRPGRAPLWEATRARCSRLL